MAAAQDGVTLRSIADGAHIPWPTFQRRIACVTPFTVTELDRIARYLNTDSSVILGDAAGRSDGAA